MSDSFEINRRDFLKQSTLATAVLAGGATLLPEEGFAATAPRLDRDKVRVGHIGCGSVSGSYLPVMTKHPNVEVVSVCDIIPERAKKRAEQFKVPNVYGNIDAMLAGAEFDFLVNTTSMPSHYPVNKKALEAGKHVWSEKPMALEVSKGKELIALAQKKGVGFWAAPNCVTSPQFAFMARTIASGKIGKVTASHGTYGHGGPTWSAWFYQKGGGSLYDLGVYNVTTLTGLLGPVTEVVGMTDIVYPTRKVDDQGIVKVEADENTMLIMRHQSGTLSHVQTGFGYFDQERLLGERKLYTIDVMGTKGVMHLHGLDWSSAGVDLAYEGEAVLETHCKEAWQYEWVGGAAYVLDCLRTGQPSLITPEHGLHVLDVMNACHESQSTGRRVKCETTFPWPIIKSA
jgi:predicted dehydrogenase